MIKLYSFVTKKGNTIYTPHRNPKGTMGGRRKKKGANNKKRR